MISLLLAIIYIAFISLGLPDALLGSAWPVMYEELNVPVSFAGIVSMIITAGTIVSSLFSDKIIQKLGTGKVTALSVGMTAAALLGFSVSDSFLLLCLWAIPYGLGAGSVDAVLNNYVALHYEAKHMSWLHCFWGVGATLGPYIMGMCLTGGLTWNIGYRSIAILQIVLTAMLFLSLPLWDKGQEGHAENAEIKSIGLRKIVKINGVKEVLVACFCYCALEATAGLWGASYMVMHRGIAEETAAKWASLFYFGITFGRFVSGFMTMKFSSKNLIRIGQACIIAGVILLLLPFGNIVLCAGMLFVGIGCAPIYPSILHETPNHFGADISQSLIGVQMASAYVGSTLMPPLFGVLSKYIGISLYPMYLFAIVVLMIVMAEALNCKKKQAA